jgi:MFS family permease
MLSYFKLLRENTDFAKLWIAQVISLFGDWFNFIALTALVSRYTEHSGLAISALLLARFLPPLLAGPIAGVVVDRFDRKRLLIWSDILRACIGISLLLATTSRDYLWLIYVATIAQFVLSAVFEPGRSALIPHLVDKENLLRANTLGNVTWSVMLAAGAALGGVVASLWGPGVALIIDAGSFGLSAWFLARIRKSGAITETQSDHSKRQASFRDGLHYVRQNPGIAAALFVKFGLSIGSVDALMVAYATTLFVIGENGTASLGILYAAFGVGAVVGPVIFNRFSDGSIMTMRRLVILSFLCVTLGWFLFGTASSLLWAALALIVRASGGSVTWTYSSTILQMSAQDEYMGRVFSLDWMGFYSAITISTLTIGFLIDGLGNKSAPAIAVGIAALSLIPVMVWGWAVFWLEKRSPVKQIPEVRANISG